MGRAEDFCRFAGEFELLALTLDRCQNPDERKDLLARMKAVIDEIEESIREEAVAITADPPAPAEACFLISFRRPEAKVDREINFTGEADSPPKSTTAELENLLELAHRIQTLRRERRSQKRPSAPRITGL